MIRLGIAVAAKGAVDPGPFLAALEQEGMLGRTDTVVHVAHDTSWLGPEPAGLVLHPCPGQGSILRLWGVAIAAAANAAYVAVLDIQVPPLPGWHHSALGGIADGCPIFHGAVEPGWKVRDRQIVGYLVEYAQFKDPLDPKCDEVPGNNVVVRRDLLPTGDSLNRHGFEKTFLVMHLRQSSRIAVRYRDNMKVCYQRPFHLGPYFVRRYRHGRCFATRRQSQVGGPGRIWCLGFTPFLPVLRIARVIRACRRDPGLTSALRRHMLTVFLAECAWSAGEASGYIFNDHRFCDLVE